MQLRRHFAFTALLGTMILSACSGSRGFLGMSNPLHPARPEDNPGGTEGVPPTWLESITITLGHVQSALGWFSLALFLLAGVAFYLSFRWMVLPKKDAFYCLFGALGCLILKVFIAPIFWLTVVVGVVMGAIVAWPYVIAFWNQYVRKPKVNALAKDGKVDEALALAKKAEPDDHHIPATMTALEARVRGAIFK